MTEIGIPVWRRELKAKRRPRAAVGDLSIAAHGTPGSIFDTVLLVARGSDPFTGYRATVSYVDDPDGGALAIQRAYAPFEEMQTLSQIAIPGTYLTEWQLRLEIWGDPAALNIRARAWRTGESEPGWMAATDNYPLIPRSDDTFAQNCTIDSVTPITP